MTGPPGVDPAAPLAGKTALVTGAATGIGKAIAGTLAAAGASVVLNHNHMPDLAGTAVAEITAAGGTAVAAAADVSIRAEYQPMVEQMLATFGRWDILVNNAAVAITKPFPRSPRPSSTRASRSTSRACSTDCNWPGRTWPTAAGSSRSPVPPPR